MQHTTHQLFACLRRAGTNRTDRSNWQHWNRGDRCGRLMPLTVWHCHTASVKELPANPTETLPLPVDAGASGQQGAPGCCLVWPSLCHDDVPRYFLPASQKFTERVAMCMVWQVAPACRVPWAPQDKERQVNGQWMCQAS